jgi:hypothetical protein
MHQHAFFFLFESSCLTFAHFLSRSLSHEKAEFWMRTLSLDTTLSIDFSMSVSFHDTMSMPFYDCTSISFDYTMSMPFDDGMSMSFDYSMSLPFDDAMSMPLDETMSLDLSMSITVNTGPTDPLLEETQVLSIEQTDPPLLYETHQCHDGLPFIMIPIDFEVDIPAIYDVESFLTDILSSAMKKRFTMCPDSSRKLSEKERKMEESTVVGVKIINVTEVSGETCSSEHSDLDCHIVNVKHQAFYQSGTLANAARAEFLSTFAACLAGVDGIRQRTASNALASESSPTTKEDDGTEKDLTRGDGLSTGKIAMIVVLSVAAASVALVVVQRKFAPKKRDADSSAAPDEAIRAFPLFL